MNEGEQWFKKMAIYSSRQYKNLIMFSNNFQKEMTLNKSVFPFFNEKFKKYRWKRSAVSTDRYSHKKGKVVYVNSLGNTNQLFFIVRGKIDALMISVRLNWMKHFLVLSFLQVRSLLKWWQYYPLYLTVYSLRNLIERNYRNSFE